MDFKVIAHVLEDNQLMLDTIGLIYRRGKLKSNEFSLEKDPVKFKEEVKAGRVEVAIIDFFLPGVDTGADIAKMIKKRNPMAKTIIISSNITGLTMAHCSNAKVDYVLDKVGDDFPAMLLEYTIDCITERQREIDFINDFNKVHETIADQQSVS